MHIKLPFNENCIVGHDSMEKLQKLTCTDSIARPVLHWVTLLQYIIVP